MIPQEVREMANPYVPMTTKLAPADFIGREEEIAKLRLILEEYRKTAAELWLRPPDELLNFLREWETVCNDRLGIDFRAERFITQGIGT